MQCMCCQHWASEGLIFRVKGYSSRLPQSSLGVLACWAGLVEHHVIYWQWPRWVWRQCASAWRWIGPYRNSTYNTFNLLINMLMMMMLWSNGTEFFLTVWGSACLWSLQVWSSPSALVCTGMSSLWSRSSGHDDGALRCRRSPLGLSLLRQCRLHRLNRCWSDAAWSYDPSPTGPGWYTNNQPASSCLNGLFLPYVTSLL